jgi:hypothetical protein
MGLSTDLKDLEIKTSDNHDLVIKNGFNSERVNNNPRRMTEIGLRGDSEFDAWRAWGFRV